MGGVWAWLRATAGLVLIAAATGVGLVVFGPQPLQLAASAAPASTEAIARSTDLAPPLPRPERPPADPHADVPVVSIGQITIPAIGVDIPFYEGVWETVIDVGPGHWPGTAAPGGYGNTVIAGHRATHGGPFRRIAELAPGDEIVLRTDAGTFTYQVTGAKIVTPKALWIVDQRPGYEITLFACHPIGSARERYVVSGTLVSATP